MRTAVAALILATAACGDARPTSGASARRWRVDSRPVLRIGAGEDGEGAQYRLLSGVRLLDDGGVLAVSDASKQVMTFDPTGELLRAEGRTGKGPGEFLHVALVPERASAADSAPGLTLVDLLQRRLSRRRASGDAWRFATLAGVNGRGPVPRAVLRDGSLLAFLAGDLPTPSRTGIVRDSAEIVILAPDGALVRSIGRVAADDRVLRLKADGSLTGGEPPFGRVLHLAATDDAIIVADGGGWEFVVHPVAGGSVDTIRLPLERRAVSEPMRRAYRARVLDGVRDEYGIAEWTMLSADDVFPDSLAAFDRMLTDRGGSIWLRATVADGDREARWFVVEAHGDALRTVTLDAGFTATDITRDRIAGVWRDPDGWEEVRVYRLVRSPD